MSRSQWALVLRRAKSVEELLPWLYLKGISSGDFGEALAVLLGADAPGLAASTIGRLMTQQTRDPLPKIYALPAPEVECIGKG